MSLGQHIMYSVRAVNMGLSEAFAGPKSLSHCLPAV